MKIDIKTDGRFEEALNELKEKYGEDFEYLNGFHNSQMNFSDFIDNFIDKNVADVTIDGNANVSHKDIVSLLSEKGKSHDKLFSFNKIFYELNKEYGYDVAKEWLEQEYTGGYYLHDAPSASQKPYCYAYDLTRLATEGLFFLDNYNNEAPKHLTTYFDDVIEFVSYFSNRSSGACGLSNLLIWSFYFWKHDIENEYYIKNPEYYLKQNFQKFIYRLNQPFLRVDQSSFTNVSIFDRNYIESLFGGVIYPDGSMVIDYVEEIIEHQKIFMEVVSEIREVNMFTFPVLTYSLLYKDGKFVDEDFARWCSDHNTKWNDSNFFVSDNVGMLSNCPLHKDTKIMYWSDYYNEFKIRKISEVYSDLSHKSRHIKVLSGGKLVEATINSFDYKPDYEITLANGETIITTANHLNKVYGKDYVETKDLTTDDYIPYSLQPITISDNMSYEDGYMVGLFLGDGSYYNSNGIVLSLNKEKKKKIVDFIYDYCPNHYGAHINENTLTSSISGKQSCFNVNITSPYLRGLIEMFVNGNNALNKEIASKAFGQSIKFRQGIIDGLYDTDGGNLNRIYTSSVPLKESLITLCATMGIITNVMEDNREGRLGTNTCYTIRLYSTDTYRQRQKNVYIKEGEYCWVKIRSIKQIPMSSHTSYCVEILDPNIEPVFMLANGVITHNCRLLSDTSKLDAFINSIGGTALSIGSVKVNTVNLVRVFYEAGKNEDKYLEILRDRVSLCCKVLDRIRHIIKRNVEKGLLPNYQDGGVELDKQYCTVGILGLYEVIKAFGYTTTDQFGYISYTDEGLAFAQKIFNTINDVKDNFTTEYSFNVESVPAERAAVVLCSKDNALYHQNETFIYSNQWIPLTAKCTIQEKLRLSSVLDKMCSGGAIAHINIENNFPNTDVAWDMLNKIAKSGVIYFAFNTRINSCKNHHGFVGTDICPHCGEPVYDTYQRIVGFLVPTKAYSKERFKEFSARQWYSYGEMLKD